MSARLFQYGVSDDPAVIAAVEARDSEWYRFHALAAAWAEERGCTEFYWSRWAGRLAVSALPSKPEGRGQWKRVGHRDKWAPYKNNTAEVEAMRAASVQMTEVPGLPSLIRSQSVNWGVYLMEPTPFIHAGRAWFGVGHLPDPTASRAEADQIGEQWQECKASEFYAAKEAHEERSR